MLSPKGTTQEEGGKFCRHFSKASLPSYTPDSIVYNSQLVCAMTPYHVSRLTCAWTLALSLSACTTPAPPTPTKTVVEAPKPDPEPETPPEDVEPAFCDSGAEELTRRAYRWCSRQGVHDGKFVVLGGSGATALEGQFDQGHMDGEWRAYHDNGQVRWSAMFAKNHENGLSQGWYDDGAKHYALPFLQGHAHGDAKFWHPGGQLAATVTYDNGKPKGAWTFWHENGERSHALSWKKNGSTSIHKHWNKKGKKVSARAGNLPERFIRPKLANAESEVISCFKHARAIQDVAGKIVVQFHIGYSGDVTRLKVLAEDFAHPFMQACTRRVFEGLRFGHNPYGPRQVIKSWNLNVQ